MIKSKRKPMNVHESARGFNHATSRTHPKNVKLRPMRGGFRL